MTNEPGLQPLRILHAPRNIAGQATDMVAALRRLGHEAELWEDRDDPFGRPSDRVLRLDPTDARATLAAIREAAERFDIVHFHYGRTLVPPRGVLPPYWDLPVLRGLGTKVFFTFHGSDARIDRIHRERNPWSHEFGAGQPDDDRVEKSIQVMRTYANALFAVSVNYLAYVPDAIYLPRVIDLAAWAPCAPRQRPRPVIVHAPTRRSTKGTGLLLAALDDLRAEGLEFELQLLEGVPHDAVRAALTDADILVDNVVAGSYGIVSLEAMACGAVAVSNMSTALREAHPDAPVVPIDPETVRGELRRLIQDPDERLRLALQGRPFLERTHASDVVAARLVEAYRTEDRAVAPHGMPDWMSMMPTRRIEQLESRIDRLEAELAGTRRRETELRARLGLPGEWTPSPLRRAMRRMVPTRIRRRFAKSRWNGPVVPRSS